MRLERLASVAVTAAVAAMSPASAFAQSLKPVCEMTGKLSDEYRGRLEYFLSNGEQRLRGFIQFQPPRDTVKLQNAVFAGETQIGLGVVFDFDIPFASAGDGAAALARNGITNLHILAGRVDSTKEASLVWVGGNLLQNYNVNATIRAAAASNGFYEARKDNRFPDGLFTFANGDRRVANTIYRTLVNGSSPLTQSLTVSVRINTTPPDGLEGYYRMDGLRTASDRVLSAAARLADQARAGQCNPG